VRRRRDEAKYVGFERREAEKGTLKNVLVAAGGNSGRVFTTEVFTRIGDKEMPNREVHECIGAISGAGAAFVWSYKEDQNESKGFAYAFGGGLGGLLAACLPDRLDPPTSANHRALAHGVIGAGLVGYGVWQCLKSITDYLDGRARTAEMSGSETGRLLGFAWHAAGGFIVGVLVGYGSHLVADGCTSKGIPLIQ
jgi:hypothetical protein